MPESIYIHIPFCLSKCHYCSFVSFPGLLEKQKSYFDALKKEIDVIKITNSTIKTIYIGGGTPSLGEVDQYAKLFNVINEKFLISNDVEISFEINPATADKTYLQDLKNLGINRLSIGAQSFCDDILVSINRKHSSSDIVNLVEDAQAVGFENISLDLIYGLPSQSLGSFKKDLDLATNLGISHLSSYGLKIEEGTHFYQHRPKNLPDEDMQAKMYLLMVDYMHNSGFLQYEISNFSYPKFESKHNMNYWKSGEYYGFGLGAHSYLDGVRASNLVDFEKYLNNPHQKEFEEKLTLKDMADEAIFLGLRMKKGIELEEFRSKFGFDLFEKNKKTIEKFINLGCLKMENKNLFFTVKGFLLSNEILAEFIF